MIEFLGGMQPALAHETARAWLARLARLRPQRALMLRVLAREVDAVGYDHKPADGLRRLVREEARHWRRPGRAGLSHGSQSSR